MDTVVTVTGHPFPVLELYWYPNPLHPPPVSGPRSALPSSSRPIRVCYPSPTTPPAAPLALHLPVTAAALPPPPPLISLRVLSPVPTPVSFALSLVVPITLSMRSHNGAHLAGSAVNASALARYGSASSASGSMAGVPLLSTP